MRHGHPEGDSDYCRVILRIREKTHEGVMKVLSARGQEDPSALVEELLSNWLAREETKRPASSWKKMLRSNMPKVELSAKLYNRLEVLATNTMTVEMLVNRAVDEYLRAKSGSPAKGPGVKITSKLR